jgi:hypothetical protein
MAIQNVGITSHHKTDNPEDHNMNIFTCYVVYLVTSCYNLHDLLRKELKRDERHSNTVYMPTVGYKFHDLLIL